MAFPQTPLPVHVYIAPGGNPAGDPGEWTWHEITDDVRVQDGIEHSAGRNDEASRVDASTCTMSIDNRSGNYSPRNPMGEWYGQLSKNTPIQVRVERASDTFDRVSASGWGTADTGQGWTHGIPASWTVNGSVGQMTIALSNTADYGRLVGANAPDIDVLYSASMSAVTTGGPFISVGLLRWSSNSNHYRVHTEFKPAGVITMKITKVVDGSTSDMNENLSIPVTYSAGQVIWTRLQADGPTIRAKCWADGNPEPADWYVTTDAATEQNGTGTGLYMWRHSTNTNVGSLIISVHTFATVALLFTGTVAEWPIRWDQTGNDCVTQIEAAGILRRLQQGQSALRSPLYRQLTGYNPAGYWPLEDGSEATAASSAAVNGEAASVVNVTFASDDTLPGAGEVVKLNGTDSTIRGRVLRSTGTGFAAMFLMKLNAMPAASTTFIQWSCSGTVKTWRIRGDATTITSEGLTADGTVLTSSSTAYGPAPTSWCAYQFEAVLSGGSISWAMIFHEVGTTTFFSHSGTEPGSVGTITGFVIPGSTGMTDAAVAHVYAGADTLPFVDATFALVSNGYEGELAADRVQRLCDEEGVRVYVEPGESQAMGRQRTETFLDLLHACEDADLGLLYESGAALGYKPYGARLNVDTEADLDFDSGHVADPPEPTDDDQRVRNDITVQRDSGGEYRAADEEHIALVGKYDEARQANVETDDQLPDLAGWLLHLGTWDEMRWPSIALDLARNSDLIYFWMSMQRVGARFSISNPPSQAEGDELDLTIEGYTQTLSMYSWDIEVACSPARAWDVAVVDDDEARVDTDGSELKYAADDNDTELIVLTTDGAQWTTDPAETPFDINVGGERVTVTAVEAAPDDEFDRTTSNGWGTATMGQVWSTNGGVAGDYSVGSGLGSASMGAVNASRYTLQTATSADVDMTFSVATGVLATGGSHFVHAVARYVDTANSYMARLEFDTSQGVTLTIRKRLASAETALATYTSSLTHGIGTRFRVRFALSGTSLMAKVWLASVDEPAGWQATATDSSFTTAGSIGTRSILSSSNTNPLPVVATYDDFSSTPIAQRMTVTRSVNGIVTAHDVGTDVRLWTAVYVSL